MDSDSKFLLYLNSISNMDKRKQEDDSSSSDERDKPSTSQRSTFGSHNIPTRRESMIRSSTTFFDESGISQSQKKSDKVRSRHKDSWIELYATNRNESKKRFKGQKKSIFHCEQILSEEDSKTLYGNREILLWSPCENQFSNLGTLTSCTAISIVSCYCFLFTRLHPLQVNWEEAIKQGGVIWSSAPSYGHTSDGLRTFKSIMESSQADYIRARVTSGKEYRMITDVIGPVKGYFTKKQLLDSDKGANTHRGFGFPETKEYVNARYFLANRIITLEDLIEKIYETCYKFGMLITSGEMTFSLLIEGRSMEEKNSGDKDVWLFDSHGGEVHKKATLIRCKSRNALKLVLAKRLGVNSRTFLNQYTPSSRNVSNEEIFSTDEEIAAISHINSRSTIEIITIHSL
jgi:hypothetical protein